jgi:hypothetical protein
MADCATRRPAEIGKIMPRTVLHVGAHKTATTYLQSKLALNGDLLARQGVRYDRLDEFREKCTRMLNHPTEGDRDFVAGLKASMKDKTVVISDENLIGMSTDLVRSGSCYPKARDRLAALGKILDLSAPDVFLAMRD